MARRACQAAGVLSLHEHGFAFSRRQRARVFTNVEVPGGHEGRPGLRKDAS
jgi:hypothetical protein